MRPIAVLTIALHALSSLLLGSAQADVLFDQIGPASGAAGANDIYGSMRFLPSGPETTDLTLAAVDNFTLHAESQIDAVEFVFDGWAALAGPQDVERWEVNIYSDLEAATSNLIGDLLSDASEPIVIDTWGGDGWLIRLPINLKLVSGAYFVSVIMSNPYPDNGWVGVATSVIGDGTAWQVSPNGDYVFSPSIEAPDNLAYRLTGTAVPAPSSVVLVVAVLAAKRRRRPLLPI